MSFKILNWKLLTKVSDEVDLTFRKALETVVRKLYISGAISTDPFQIMNAQKSFYSKTL